MTATASLSELLEKNESVHTTRHEDVSLMVVDDSPQNLKLLDDMLRQCGYRVRFFPSGKLALAAAAKNQPDLILLDINMPELDGFEVCTKLKSDPLLAEIPVIFLSARDDTADKVKAFRSGGIDYITKPFQVEEVRARVDTHLEVRRQKKLLEKSYQQLEQLEILQDNLLHMIVHDMRTPLTIIQGVLELISQLDAEHLTEKGLLRLAKAKKGTSDLIGMVNSLLDISKLESGSMTLRAVDYDLAKLAQEVVQSHADNPGGHSIISVCPEQETSINGDRALVSRVIQNLLGNAIKYSPHNSKIFLEVSRSEDSLKLTVHDEGPGVLPEHRQKIFDKFYQVGSQKNSSGLGLAFCKLAIEAHGGTIGVDSDTGKGSTFWFVLPREFKQA